MTGQGRIPLGDSPQSQDMPAVARCLRDRAGMTAFGFALVMSHLCAAGLPASQVSPGDVVLSDRDRVVTVTSVVPLPLDDGLLAVNWVIEHEDGCGCERAGFVVPADTAIPVVRRAAQAAA
jgi:hypothetical protein